MASAASGYLLPIGCFVVLFAFISPRLALFALFLFSDLLSRAFDSWFVPFLGFFLLPWTTLAYVVMWSSSDRVARLRVVHRHPRLRDRPRLLREPEQGAPGLRGPNNWGG